MAIIKSEFGNQKSMYEIAAANAYAPGGVVRSGPCAAAPVEQSAQLKRWTDAMAGQQSHGRYGGGVETVANNKSRAAAQRDETSVRASYAKSTQLAKGKYCHAQAGWT